MEEVGHSSLDYNDVKQPSLSSRSYRVKIMPENGSSFKAGQVVYLSLPSGLPATYVDFRSNVYLKFDMTVDGTVVLDKAFALSWIRRLAIESTGTLLNDIQGFNVLLAMSNDLQVNPLTKMNQMSVTSGAGQVIGNTLTAGTYTFCVPIPLNVFSMAQRAIPLFSNDKLTLRLTVDDAVKWGKWTVAPNENNNVITNLELTCDFNELDSQAQMMIDQAVGGVYNIMTTGIQNFQSTLSTVTGPTNINRQIGISVASLDRMFFVFREAVNLNSNTKFGIGGRCNPKLTSAQLFINNLAIPQRPLKGTTNNNAEAVNSSCKRVLAIMCNNGTNRKRPAKYMVEILPITTNVCSQLEKPVIKDCGASFVVNTIGIKKPITRLFKIDDGISQINCSTLMISGSSIPIFEFFSQFSQPIPLENF